jgi:TetR/AcrR family tetracycline transcriptional repressor
MLDHRDGGRLVAGTFAGSGKTLRVADVIVGALLDAGYAEDDAARLCWALVYFTLGLTQEQQTSPPESAVDVGDVTDEGRYPALAKVGARLLFHDSFDARFDYGVANLLHPR